MTEIYQFYDWCEQKKIWIPLIHTEAIAEKFDTHRCNPPKQPIQSRSEKIAERREKLKQFQHIKI